MSDTNSWRDVLTKAQLLNAAKWYAEHQRHVLSVSRRYVGGFPPTDNLDKNQPELWKPQHWAWFLRHWGASWWMIAENRTEGDGDE